MAPDAVEKVGFEIADLRMNGLVVNDPALKYRLRSGCSAFRVIGPVYDREVGISTRNLSRSKLARPYVDRLMNLSRWIWPSTCVLLHGKDRFWQNRSKAKCRTEHHSERRLLQYAALT
jgi:hypothetical protein